MSVLEGAVCKVVTAEDPPVVIDPVVTIFRKLLSVELAMVVVCSVGPTLDPVVEDGDIAVAAEVVLTADKYRTYVFFIFAFFFL